MHRSQLRFAFFAAALTACSARDCTQRHDKPLPNEESPDAAAALPRGAEDPRPSVGPASRAARMKLSSTLLGVTRDSAKALIRVGDVHAADRRSSVRFRWVDVKSGTVTEEWTEPERVGLPWETLTDSGHERTHTLPASMSTPGFAADVRRHASALARLTHSHDDRFAVSDDGMDVVFNGGDWLYVASAADGKVRARVSSRASYRPHFIPGSHKFVYSRHQGSLDGVVGDYRLVVASSKDPTNGRVLPDTRDTSNASLYIAADGSALYARRGGENRKGGCLIRVELSSGAPTRAVACAPKGELLEQVLVSRDLKRAALRMRSEARDSSTQRIVWVDLPAGGQTSTASVDRTTSLAFLRDDGVLLTGVAGKRGGATALLDPQAHSMKVSSDGARPPYEGYGATFLTPSRYLSSDDGMLVTVDLKALSWTSSPLPP